MENGMKKSRKLVEAVQNIRHCPNTVIGDSLGNSVSVVVCASLWRKVVEEYDALIEELKKETPV
jgi:flagellar biosynthesis/type III secretory pathway M-ring protein FliF/YscJ